MSDAKPTPAQKRRIVEAIANNGELVRKATDRAFWTVVNRMRAAGLVDETSFAITDAARAVVDMSAPAVAVVHAFSRDPERAAAATLCGDGPNVRGPREIVNCPACLALVEEQRRVNAIEAVRASGDTTTTPRAMRLIGAITEHGNYGSAMDALHVEAADDVTVVTVPIPAAPAIGVEDAVGNPLHEGDAVALLGEADQMYAVSHADPEGRGLWIYPLGVSMGKERQVSAVEVHKQVFANVDGVVKYVPAVPAPVEADDDAEGWGQPDGMLGVTEAERAAAEPTFEQDALVTAETRAVIDSLVEAIIAREYGRSDDGLDNDDVVRGAHMLARAAVKMDLHAHYVARAGTAIGLDGFADSTLGRLKDKGLKARACECANGTKHANTLHVHVGPCTGHVEADVPTLDDKRLCGPCHVEAYATLPADVLEIAKAADLFELACTTGVEIDERAAALHALMRPYFAGLLVEAIALGIEQGAIMPETSHTTRIEAPPSTSGHWEASCTGCHVGGTGYEDPIEAVGAALAHGPLAADTGTVLANVEPDEETLGDLETITELAALIVAGPRSAMVEQTLKDTIDAIGMGKPIG